MSTVLSRQSLGPAWVSLTLVLAIHVADEATHDFLSVYNPAVTAIRTRLPFLPLPVFSFSVWLTGLILAVLILLALAPIAYRGHHWLVCLTFPFAGLMFANGLGHIGYSLYRHALMPGVWSSPLLLAASAWLFLCACRAIRSPVAGAAP